MPTLKPILGITEYEATADIKGPPPPKGIPSARWRGNKSSGSDASLAWYRGHQAGIHDAFLTIKKRYPRVAKQLREAFGMEENGSIILK